MDIAPIRTAMSDTLFALLSQWLSLTATLYRTSAITIFLTEHTKLEKWDENGKPYLEEYAGSGKLKAKQILITGGDSGKLGQIWPFRCASVYVC
jgi:hypothetical protein